MSEITAGTRVHAGVLTGTVLSVENGYASLDWDADADGGPYEDEVEVEALTVIDDIDAHYLDLAAAVDAITGNTFRDELIDALYGTAVEEMLSDYINDNDDEDNDDEDIEALRDTLRDGHIEVLIDNATCDLHGHGYYLDRNDDGLHVLVAGPSF